MKNSLQKYSQIHISQLYPFWNDDYKNLEYTNEKFNDQACQTTWLQQGYADKFTGDMCDMRKVQPSWNQRFIELFADRGWQDIGTSYYRMNTGTVLPTHSDTFVKYISLYDLHERKNQIRRAIIFLEDWQPGHYAEYMYQPFVNWSAGAVVEWTYDAPHMAANLGITPRYTLQITGHVHD